LAATEWINGVRRRSEAHLDTFRSRSSRDTVTIHSTTDLVDIVDRYHYLWIKISYRTADKQQMQPR